MAMSTMLLITAAIFAFIAAFSHQVFDHLTRNRRLRPPHRYLVLGFRLWFGILALATFWLLLHQPHTAG